jgi:hypothetical protein
VSKQRTNNYKKRASEHLEANRVPQQQQARLPSGKNFARLWYRIEPTLQTALRAETESVRTFFKRFPFVSSDNPHQVDLFIKGVKDKSVQRALHEYVRFARRFAVRVTLESKPPFFLFQVESARLSGAKFWGKILHGGLVPWLVSESEFADFHHPDLALPRNSEPLFESGRAKWFQIDDPKGDSLLAEIEEVAYDPDAIVFLFHDSRQPFLFCLVGENVNDTDWKKASQIRTRFQQQMYQTGTRGRTPNMEKRSKQYKAVQSKEPMKNIAIDLTGDSATDKQVSSEERALRRRKSELKKRH